MPEARVTSSKYGANLAAASAAGSGGGARGVGLSLAQPRSMRQPEMTNSQRPKQPDIVHPMDKRGLMPRNGVAPGRHPRNILLLRRRGRARFFCLAVRRLDDVRARVGAHIGQGLTGSAGPSDLDRIEGRLIAQSEVQGMGGLRQIAARAGDLARERLVAAAEANDGADRVAVAARAAQTQRNVVLLRQLVLEEVGLIIEVVDDEVEPAGVGEVGDSGATRAARRQPAADQFLLMLAA